MSGQVLYRKWRPPSFADIVGQGSVTQTLAQAVATNRTAHAYLLCGPRGTGKTSTARVLAKALNCTGRPDGVGDPCGVCNACAAIDQGNFVDLIELDAASNRGIDEMRDLREKVRFAPTHGKMKVYIIDEAHALTSDAFNAFLKTLEEPPPQTAFVLATTEPHRLPATIVSRCQRFDFHRITPSDVVGRLTEIAAAEGVDVSPEVLRNIARASSGSLRDATNLLDQLITSFGAHVTLEQVQELLGIGGEEHAVALVKHVLGGNTTSALELINEIASEGIDLRPLHRMTVDFLRAALLMRSGVHDAIELSKEAHAEISFAAGNVSIEHVLRALRLFGQVSLKFDQPSPLPLELAVVELSLEPAAVAPQPRPQQAPTPQSRPQQPSSVAPQPRPQQPASVAPQPRPQQPAPAPVPVQPEPTYGGQQAPEPVANGAAAQAAPSTPVPVDPNAPPAERLVAQWPTILRALGRIPRKRFDVAALLRSSSKREIEGQELVVHFVHQSNAERLQAELDDPRCRIEVESVLEQALGENFSLHIASSASGPVNPSTADAPGHLVRAAMSLGGQMVREAVASAPEAPPAAESPATVPEAESTVPEAEPPAPATDAPVAKDDQALAEAASTAAVFPNDEPAPGPLPGQEPLLAQELEPAQKMSAQE
jgi:DNA polymerase-3 subunit gamma/tau